MTEVRNSLFRNGSVWEKFLLHTEESIFDIDFRPEKGLEGNVSEEKITCSAPLIRSLKLTPETLPCSLDQWLELYHPDDYPKSLEFRRRVFADRGHSFTMERRLYCGDGQYRRFRVSAVCLRDAAGRIERLICTEAAGGVPPAPSSPSGGQLQVYEPASLGGDGGHKRREADGISPALLTRMLDATSDLLFYCDEAGRLLLWNEAFSKALKLNPGLMNWVAGLAKGNEASMYRCADAYGRLRSLSARVLSFWTPDGKKIGNAASASDVTEREALEEDLERLKRLLAKKSFLYDRQEDDFSDIAPVVPVLESTSGAFGETKETGEDISEDINLEDREELSDPHEFLEAHLRKALKASSLVYDFLPARASQLENLLHAVNKEELEVGVVGITSSGKSTLINAMMGERLLPEETRATTNLLIRCRKGEFRAVTLVLKNGERQRVTGSQLTPAWMESMASERLNPGNERGVAFLEWTSPGAVLPEGLTLMDTPGLDACGFPEHSELVMRRLLPNLDIVLYITSIRNRFKIADIELLEALLEQDQRVVFLLSQIDLERDDLEGGQVVFSRREKLSAYIRELRLDVENVFPKGSALRDSPILPVSSKLAMTHFYNRDSSDWKASNFASLIGQLELFQSNLGRYRTETRARRALMLLSRTAFDLRQVLKNISAAQARNERNVRLEKVKDLREAQRWTSAEISAVRNEWRPLLDLQFHEKWLKKMESAYTAKGVKDYYGRWLEEWTRTSAQMIDRIDRALQACRDILEKHGIASLDRDAPAAGGIEEAAEGEPDWFETLDFGPRQESLFQPGASREKILAEIKRLLAERSRLLNDYLAWWENRMREDFCDPLYEELQREESALSDVKRVISDASISRKTLRHVLRTVREAERGIRNVMADLFLPQAEGPADSFDRFDADSGGDDDLDAPEEGLFAPLLAAFHEQNIQSRFLELESLRRCRRVVLLGLRRHDSIRLLSRLAHDAAFGYQKAEGDTEAHLESETSFEYKSELNSELKSRDGEKIGERDWLFYGTTPPALPHVPIDLPDTLLRDLEVLVAPGDTFCGPGTDWGDLFAEWLPVIHLDVARIDSGLADLARAPYATALAHAACWVAASGQGALFNGRLGDLLTDVPDRLDLFIRHQGYRGRAEWFIYENYDARYTDFMLWGRNPERDADGEGLLRQWIESGHDFKPPFLESRMRFALEGARRKSFRVGKGVLLP